MSEEKRRYFRLKDHISLAYRPADGRCAVSIPAADPIAAIGESDERIERLLSEIGASEPRVAELIGLLNRKIERAVAQALVQGRRDRWSFERREVSISACGLGFTTDESAPLGSEWAVALRLESDTETIYTGAAIVGVDGRGNGQFYWRMDFNNLSGANRERLISHLVRRQAEQLRDRHYR